LDEEVIKYASPQLKAIAGISLEQFKAAATTTVTVCSLWHQFIFILI